MPQIKFTDTFIKSVKPTDALQDFLDTQTKGLHLRVTSNGVKSFVYSYRSKVTGKPVNETLGRYPDLSYAIARGHVLKGHTENATSKPVTPFIAVKKNDPTVDEAFAEYKESKLANLRSDYEISINLTAIIARHKWGPLPITSLTKAMIRDALNHYVKVRDAKQSALKSQQRISTWLKWCSKQDLIPINPIVGGVLDVKPGKPRERTLTDGEIRKLWRACENPEAFGLRTSYARALQLLLVTGARSGMVCGMPKEGELDLRNAEGPLWDVPAARMKTGVPFICPLSDMAVSIIRRATEDNPYICPTTSKFLKDKNRLPLDGRQLSYVVRGLCETLAFDTPFTPHDLRRTATELLCREYDENAVSRFIAHETTRGVMKHYNPTRRWKYLAEKRAISSRWAVILKGIIGDNVIRLREVA